MPLIGSTIQTFTMAKAASTGLVGSKLLPMVSAVSNATAQYLMVSSIVNSTNNVIGPGAGTGTGKIIGLVPSAMSSLMQIKAAGLGLVGKDIKRLFDAISFGVIQALNFVIVQGPVIGGGPGTGIGKVTGLVPSALQGIIYTNLLGKLMTGSKASQLASAISFGICNHIMTAGTVQLVDVGAFTPPPVGPIPIPTAPGIGRFT